MKISKLEKPKEFKIGETYSKTELYNCDDYCEANKQTIVRIGNWFYKFENINYYQRLCFAKYKIERGWKLNEDKRIPAK